MDPRLGGFSTDGPDDLTLSGFALLWGVEIWSDATNVVIDRMDGGSFLVAGADKVTIQNSDWGPCTPSGTYNGQFSGCRHYFERDPESGQPRIFDVRTRNVLIKNNTFHDMVSDVPGSHWECLWIAGGQDISFSGNFFDNCATNAIALGDDPGNDSNVRGSWLFTGNWCGRVPIINGCFKFGQLPYEGTMTFRLNSFALGSSIEDEERGDSQGRVIIERNILGRGRCVGGAVYMTNLVEAPAGCGSTDRVSIFGYTYDAGRLLPAPREVEAVRAAFSEVANPTFKSLASAARTLSRRRYVGTEGRMDSLSRRSDRHRSYVPWAQLGNSEPALTCHNALAVAEGPACARGGQEGR